MESLNTKNPPEVVVEDEPQHYLFPEISHPKKRAFLTALALCGSAYKAGQVLKWHDSRNHYFWLQKDPVYAAAADRARQLAASQIEDKLYELGVEGYDKPVLYEGRITATYKEYSVTSLIFLAKGNNHEKYRENFRDSNGGGGSRPATIQFLQFNQFINGAGNNNPAPLSPEKVSASSKKQLDPQS